MTEKKKSSPQKGDFIDLEKGQYKKYINFRKYFLISFILVSLILFAFLYFNLFNFNNLSILNNFDKNPKLLEEQISTTNLKKEFSKIDDEQINLIKSKLDDLSAQIINNQIKLSETNEIVSNLIRQMQISERRNQQNLDFLVAEKYIILNELQWILL